MAPWLVFDIAPNAFGACALPGPLVRGPRSRFAGARPITWHSPEHFRGCGFGWRPATPFLAGRAITRPRCPAPTLHVGAGCRSLEHALGLSAFAAPPREISEVIAAQRDPTADYTTLRYFTQKKAQDRAPRLRTENSSAAQLVRTNGRKKWSQKPASAPYLQVGAVMRDRESER
jgi:hypothetical protein